MIEHRIEFVQHDGTGQAKAVCSCGRYQSAWTTAKNADRLGGLHSSKAFDRTGEW